MNDNDIQKLSGVLEEIRENQKLPLERQLEALTIQREQFAIFQRQVERTERIQNCLRVMAYLSSIDVLIIRSRCH